MKKGFLFIALAALTLVACEKKTDVTTDKEEALQKVAAPYVHNTVVAIYKNMADAGLVLMEQTNAILEKVSNDQDYTQLMKDADASWRLMRKYWEQSEAFLYGPAFHHAIDPHIDSWPLDFNQMNALLWVAGGLIFISLIIQLYQRLMDLLCRGTGRAYRRIFVRIKDLGTPSLTV